MTAITIDQQGHWAVTASDDDTLRVWDLSAREPESSAVVLPGHSGDITAVTIDRASAYIISGNEDGTMRVWDLRLKDLEVRPTVLHGH